MSKGSQINIRACKADAPPYLGRTAVEAGLRLRKAMQRARMDSGRMALKDTHLRMCRLVGRPLRGARPTTRQASPLTETDLRGPLHAARPTSDSAKSSTGIVVSPKICPKAGSRTLCKTRSRGPIGTVVTDFCIAESRNAKTVAASGSTCSNDSNRTSSTTTTSEQRRSRRHKS